MNGLLGVFLLAIASRRAFFIDSPRPVPMHMLLAPRRLPRSCGVAFGESEFLLDWRTHGALTAAGRRTNYNDRYTDLVADLPWLLSEEPEAVVVLRSNQRVTLPILQNAEARTLLGPAVTDNLLAQPYLHAELLELLFEPTPLLASRAFAVLDAARAGRKRLVAIHFRSGDRSAGRWQDPPRHALSELDLFFDCAEAAEWRLGWESSEVAWYLATDTVDVSSSRRVSELRAQGKLAVLPAGHGDSAVIHLDRSPMEFAVQGVVDTWAQWLAIAAADAAVLSASGFGITAAEAGRVPHAFLGTQGCLPTDLTAA